MSKREAGSIGGRARAEKARAKAGNGSSAQGSSTQASSQKRRASDSDSTTMGLSSAQTRDVQHDLRRRRQARLAERQAAESSLLDGEQAEEAEQRDREQKEFKQEDDEIEAFGALWRGSRRIVGVTRR